MMLLVLQPLLQGKSNHQAVGLAFHFEKCQVGTRPNPRIICGAAGGLSGGWRSSRAPAACAGTDEGSEEHLSAMGKRVQADTAHCPCSGLSCVLGPSLRTPSMAMWSHLAVLQGRATGGRQQVSPRWTRCLAKTLKMTLSPPCDYGSLAH